MAKTIEEKIQELEKELKQAKALAAKKKSLEKAQLAQAERAKDTRKKILLGAFILDGGVDPLSLLNQKGFNLDQWLLRDDERAIFGLKSLTENAS